MKEPKRIKLTETPSHKDANKIPLPPLYKPEWDLGQDNDDVYVPIEKKDEDNSQNDTQSI
jgi:hypothetical protein